MPKPNLGKTETIKERAIYVYLPSEEAVREWKELADKAGVSISKFVQEHVENSLNQERREGDYKSRLDLIKRIRELEAEASRLREENRMYRLLSEKLDREMMQYKAKPFTEEEYSGTRSYERELVVALKKRGFVAHEELLGLLGIDPKDTELTKAVNKQLESLEAYGLIQGTPRGWEWRK